MRILLWHGYLLEGTGSNVYTRAIAREWARAGHDVVVFCQDPNPGRFDRDPDVIGRQVGANGAVVDASRLGDVVREKNIIVGVIAVPASSAQQAADELVDSGVRIIFNYSEALLDVPHDVQVHTSNPAVELLHALYFHLT